MSQVSQLYDTLFSFEAGKHDSAYPIHKRLQLDVRYADLIDWLMDQVHFSEGDRVLDAGCGTGYSLVKLAKEKGISGKGISLSEREIAFARQKGGQLKLDRQVQFEVASFENPLTEKYDKILAIESIKHVADIEAIVSNLTNGLEEDGLLIIADDFVLEKGSDLLSKHEELWQVPGFDLRERTINSLEQKGWVVNQHELTKHVPKRSKSLLSLLMVLVRLVLILAPDKHRLKLEIYLGGLMLEQLYNLEQVGYFVLIAQNNLKSRN